MHVSSYTSAKYLHKYYCAAAVRGTYGNWDILYSANFYLTNGNNEKSHILKMMNLKQNVRFKCVWAKADGVWLNWLHNNLTMI